MIIKKNIKGKRIIDASGFVRAYAYDSDHPDLDNHIFLMFNVLIENGLLDSQFESQYGNIFVRMYIKNIDFIPYNIYVFKRDINIINEVLLLGGIEHKLPLEDDDSLYLSDDHGYVKNNYSLTLESQKIFQNNKKNSSVQ